MPYIFHVPRCKALGVKPLTYAQYQAIAVAITRLSAREAISRTFHNSRSN